jgi:heme/copper-type cytochrome/quinol oxidase subunit 1
MGIVSEVMATNSRKPIFGYRAMIMSVIAIAFLSTIVWGHHMFISGMNPFLGSVFTFTTLLIAIPSAVKAFNWITTLWKGNLQLNPAMLFSIGMVSTFITGGLTGIILGDSTLDINVHDTYFVVAHFHLVMGISALYGMFAGIYHWFPRMFGRMLNKNLGYVHFWVTAVCAYGVFFPMHFIGMAGLPRRYYTNTTFPLFDDLAKCKCNHYCICFSWWCFPIGVFMEFLPVVFSMVKISSKSLEIKYIRMDCSKLNICMETGLEKFLKFTDGLMIIANQVMMKILFLKCSNERR